MEKIYSDRQIEIIEAAIKLIGSGGIQKLTTKNIALKVGITEPAIYRHFINKVDILKGTLHFLKQNTNSRFRNICESKKTAIQKINNLFESQFKTFTQKPEFVVVLMSEGLYQNEKELSEMVYSIMQSSSKHFIKIIEEGQEDGSIRKDINSKQLAFILMGSMRLCVIQWHLSGFSFDLIKKGQELCKSLILILNPS